MLLKILTLWYLQLAQVLIPARINNYATDQEWCAIETVENTVNKRLKTCNAHVCPGGWT